MDRNSKFILAIFAIVAVGSTTAPLYAKHKYEKTRAAWVQMQTEAFKIRVQADECRSLLGLPAPARDKLIREHKPSCADMLGLKV